MNKVIKLFRNQRMYENNLRMYSYIVEPPFERMCSGTSSNIDEIIGKIRELKAKSYRVYFPIEESHKMEEYPLHPLDAGQLLRQLKL